MSSKEITKVDKSMLEASVANVSSSVINTIHKVKLYNPNFFNGEEMDEELKGKFILTEAGTGNKVTLNPFSFNILYIEKVLQGNVTLLNKYGDVKLKNGKPVTTMFYSSGYDRFAKADTVIGIKSKTTGGALFFKKGDFLELARAIQVNGEPNPFFTWGKDAKGVKYKSSLMNSIYVMYGVFTDGDYEGEYFQMYIKENYFGKDYKFDKDTGKSGPIEPKEGTLLSILNSKENIENYNKLLVDNGINKKVNRLSLKDLDIKANVITVENEQTKKVFNTLSFELIDFTAKRTNNSQDIVMINEIVYNYFKERFENIGQPLDVIIEQEGANAIVKFDFNDDSKFDEHSSGEQIDIDVATDIFEGETDSVAVKNGAPF